MKAAQYFILVTGVVTGLAFGQEPPRPPGPPSPTEGPAGPAPNVGRPSLARPEADRPQAEGFRPPREFDRPRSEGERPPQGARPRRHGEDPPFPGQTPRPRPHPGDDSMPPGSPRGVAQRPPERLQPYIGVITRNAPPELTAQIRQTEGFGLVVEDVLPDSPAQAAGLQRNDLLLRFDDQLLANPGQFEALIRRTGKDKEATLTLLRGGAEQKITLKVGEKMLPERRLGPRPGSYREGGSRPLPPQDGAQGNPSFAPNELSRTASEGSTPRYALERARVVRRDPQGLYELAQTDGADTFIVKDTTGKTVWSGPVTTPEQREAIPAEWRGKLGMLEDARNPEHRPPPIPQPLRPVQ